MTYIDLMDLLSYVRDNVDNIEAALDPKMTLERRFQVAESVNKAKSRLDQIAEGVRELNVEHLDAVRRLDTDWTSTDNGEWTDGTNWIRDEGAGFGLYVEQSEGHEPWDHRDLLTHLTDTEILNGRHMNRWEYNPTLGHAVEIPR